MHMASGMDSLSGQPMELKFPSPDSASSTSPEADKESMICPLASGQVNECVPQFCGINAPCLSSQAEPPEIEECDQAPCVQRTFSMDDTAALPTPQSAWPTPPKQKNESLSPLERKDTAANDASNSSGQAPSAAPRGRQAHSLVERKYRENLNAKIEELFTALQKTQMSRRGESRLPPQGQSMGTAARVRKSDILAEALNYIYQSEVDMRHMADEISRLKNGTKPAAEKVNKCDDCSLRKQVMNLRLMTGD